METKRAEISEIIAKYGKVQNLIGYVNAETLKAKHMEMPKRIARAEERKHLTFLGSHSEMEQPEMVNTEYTFRQARRNSKLKDRQ